MSTSFCLAIVSIKPGDKVELQYKITRNNFGGSTGTTVGVISHVVTAVEEHDSLGGDISYEADHIITYSNGNETIKKVSFSVYKTSTFPFQKDELNVLKDHEKQNATYFLISFCDTLLTTGEGLIANEGEFIRLTCRFTVIYEMSVIFKVWWGKDGRLISCNLEVKNQQGDCIIYEIGGSKVPDPYDTYLIIIGIIGVVAIVITIVCTRQERE
jgi:hypothetical protein